MNPIPESAVRKVWRRMDRITPNRGLKLSEKFTAEQPALAAYVLGVDEDVLNDEERSLLFFIGLAIWQIMKQGDTPPPVATVEQIQKAEAANVAALEKLAEAQVDAEALIRSMLVEYSQPGVLGSVVLMLMAPMEGAEPMDAAGAEQGTLPMEGIDHEPPQEPSEGIRDENLGIMLLDAKTIIDVLNA